MNDTPSFSSITQKQFVIFSLLYFENFFDLWISNSPEKLPYKVVKAHLITLVSGKNE